MNSDVRSLTRQQLSDFFRRVGSITLTADELADQILAYFDVSLQITGGPISTFTRLALTERSFRADITLEKLDNASALIGSTCSQCGRPRSAHDTIQHKFQQVPTVCDVC